VSVLPLFSWSGTFAGYLNAVETYVQGGACTINSCTWFTGFFVAFCEIELIDFVIGSKTVQWQQL
jgi:hypothetical protein